MTPPPEAGRHRLRHVAVALAVVTMALSGCDPDGEPASGSDPECAVETDEGFRSLFDGTRSSLDEWRMAGPGSFELDDDCSMVTTGGMGLLWFPEEFEDYVLRVEWKVAGDDNSGVFVGFPEPAADPWIAVDHGYEIQIDASDEPERTTGAVYTFQSADIEARDRALNPPGEWNAYEIAVEDQHLTVRLNGVLVNDFVSDHPERDLRAGHIGLQNHGDGDEVYFRHVQVRESSGTD